MRGAKRLGLLSSFLFYDFSILPQEPLRAEAGCLLRLIPALISQICPQTAKTWARSCNPSNHSLGSIRFNTLPGSSWFPISLPAS